MSDRNKLIIRDVAYNGLSYSEAAKKHGVTVGVVAGVCWRAGIKIGGKRDHQREKMAAAVSEAASKWHRANRKKSLAMLTRMRAAKAAKAASRAA